MKMIKVESSHIDSIGYSNKNLYVKFNSGTYVYSNVPKKLYEELLKADSKGKFMNAEIKNKYEVKKVEEK